MKRLMKTRIGATKRAICRLDEMAISTLKIHFISGRHLDSNKMFGSISNQGYQDDAKEEFTDTKDDNNLFDRTDKQLTQEHDGKRRKGEQYDRSAQGEFRLVRLNRGDFIRQRTIFEFQAVKQS